MENNEYIHINEAVKVYNKTRQTFYNYIKKWQIASKKINNKVYLKIDDIEKLISDYIHIDDSTMHNTWEVIAPQDYQEYNQIVTSEEQERKATSVTTFQENLQKDLLRLHKQYYSLKDDVFHEIQRSKQDILFDSKAISYNQEQRIITNLSQQYSELNHQKKYFNEVINNVSLKNKKISFWLWYTTIIVLQLLIGRYIL